LKSPELLHHVDEAVQQAKIIDIHTHLYPPRFQDLCFWGIDDLLIYHYLVEELFRSSRVTPREFFALSKPQQADLIWDTLFVKNTPLSEAAAGVVSVMTRLGLDPCQPDLKQAREYFASLDVEQHVQHVLSLAGVSDLVMTNDPFNTQERELWEKDTPYPESFHTALRLDPLLNTWNAAEAAMAAQGYNVYEQLSPVTLAEIRRFLDRWIARLHPVYLAASLPFSFNYPDETPRTLLLREAVFPTCREHRIPFAMMIGVARGVNPEIGEAGDSLGYAEPTAVERIARENPQVRLLVTMLARENQHALCVAARKFSNLMPFGCWWFLNNPSIVAEITRERLELLGTSFIPQHSDARILEQLIYKWAHSRRTIAQALSESYQHLVDDGYPLTREQINRDVERLFSGNFRSWAKLSLPST